MKYRNSSTIVYIITVIVVLLLAVGVIGALVKLTDNIDKPSDDPAVDNPSGNPEDFYVTVGDKTVKDTESGFIASSVRPITVNVHLGESIEDYTVKVVPNKLRNTDFTIRDSSDQVQYHDFKDLTRGFEITKTADGFTLTPKGDTLADILVSGTYVNPNFRGYEEFQYKDMFKLLITSSDGEAIISLCFGFPDSTTASVADIELDKTNIVF